MNNKKDEDLTSYRLYYDAAENLPELKVNYLVKKSFVNEWFTLFEKEAGKRNYKKVADIEKGLIENSNWNQFIAAFNEYSKNITNFTVDIDDCIVIPRHTYDDHPLENRDSIHMTWIFCIEGKYDEKKSQQTYKTITERLAQADVIFHNESGLTSSHHVYCGNNGFLIRQSDLDLKKLPDHFERKPVLSERQKRVLKNKINLE